MSDVKNATIIPYWKVLARFGAHVFPRGDMHPCCYCETYVGGLTQGLVGSKVVKRWHARKQEVRT